ncbi:GreA/GreB family elongation factor [Clostridium sp. CM028]|uniref:GreA/GreB family elongation factor n=1 Tax=unclassified Clostridium TaxID=2614128 RepID=UPI001C6F5076|nr:MULTISPECIES: GreA/GreB family elongation factor [unclassified Clostridium]MBW9147226.1 GreA/GreB family elongation factor [Clostridium sp. CM027]MBW9150511.1 GreA/GreB family elongation factor [Clostridium sp. CM028]UVE40845.1 GreA/GreB family elongation factor [Clostridium sp. CM027]WLC61511.1 GreA/GreB family elongation factor [Clostridium sp. CM028]
MNNKLTKKDLEDLQKEFDYRKGPLTMEIAHEKMIAAAHGDRSENAEYKAAKTNMYENYRRMGYLIKMIRTAEVIDDVIYNTKGANISDKLMIKFEGSDDIEEIELVTTLQVDILNGKFSIESPIGMVLFGKTVGTIVEVASPDGNYKIELLSITKE